MPPKRKSSASASASVNGGEKAKKAAKPQPDASEDGAIPMGRQLASTEKKTRDAAIRSLSLYLTQQSSSPSSSSSLFSSPLEIAKLWKGIFYCFWMSDKPLVQQALAQELSDLLLAVPGEEKVPAPPIEGFQDSVVGEVTVKVYCGLALFEGFADVMVREWSGLDKWRVDKFYLLIRRFVNAALRLLSETAWDPTSTSQFSRILTKQGGLLCPNDQRVPDSLTYHFTDVFLTELEKACGGSDEGENSRGPVQLLLRPIIHTAATCHSKTVYDKIMRNIVQPLDDDLLLGEKARKHTKIQHEDEEQDGEEDEDEDEEREFASIARASSLQSEVKFRAHLYKMIFEEASSQDALPSNRRKMYAYFQKETDRKEMEDDDESDEDEGEEA